jgi:hypothetical protein
MLVFLGLQVINDLCSPRALHTMSAVAAARLHSQTPVRKRGIRIVGLQRVRKIHDWPFCRSERISQSFDIGDGADQKWHIDVGLGMLPSDMSEVPVPMQEVVLHIDNYQSGFVDFRSLADHWHFLLPNRKLLFFTLSQSSSF